MSSTLAFVIVLAVVTPPLVAMTQDSASVQGEWSLNRDLTPAPPKRDDDVRRPEGRRPPGGGFPGGAGLPGGGFGGGDPGGGRRGPSEKDMRKLEAVRRRIAEVPQRLVISIDGTRVQVVDELGRAANLVADGKKQDRLTGDGEFKSITKLDGGRLVVEEDFDGPKVTTTYQRLASNGRAAFRSRCRSKVCPRDAAVAATKTQGPRSSGSTCGRGLYHSSELSVCASHLLSLPSRHCVFPPAWCDYFPR